MRNVICLGIILSSGLIYSQDSLIFPVNFVTGECQPDSVERKSIRMFVKSLDFCKINKIVIEAYCDDRGSAQSNKKLSLLRAISIESLLKNFGDSTTIRIHRGMGERALVTLLDLNIQRSRNRMAEIKIYYNCKNRKGAQKIDSSRLDLSLSEFLFGAKNGERLDLNINFQPGLHFLIKVSEVKVDSLYQILSKTRRKILIEGHIKGFDGSKSEGWDLDTYETKLSENRAKYIYDLLVKKGIAAERLRYIGMKAKVPSTKGPNYDRRVEIVLEN